MYIIEIFTLDRETMCHKFALANFKAKDCSEMFALAEGVDRTKSLSMQIPNTLIEMNLWNCERKEYVEEIIYENGIKIN